MTILKCFFQVDYLPVNISLMIIVSTANGESRPFYRDVYTIGGRDGWYFYPIWMTMWFLNSPFSIGAFLHFRLIVLHTFFHLCGCMDPSYAETSVCLNRHLSKKVQIMWNHEDDWCMQNSCIKFVVYCCIFQHIYMLWDIIIMFCIDFGIFPNNPLSFGFNFFWQKIPFLAFFYFPGTTGLETELGQLY
jgi:hypothetical protein